MRILLLGATGLIGSAVAPGLRRDGHEIVAVAAASAGEPLPDEYRRLFRRWFAFGFPAFTAVLAIFWLMIARPEIHP